MIQNVVESSYVDSLRCSSACEKI